MIEFWMMGPMPEPEPLHPVFPSVRCVRCGHIYTLPEALRERTPILGRCTACGGQSFNTVMLDWREVKPVGGE